MTSVSPLPSEKEDWFSNNATQMMLSQQTVDLSSKIVGTLHNNSNKQETVVAEPTQGKTVNSTIKILLTRLNKKLMKLNTKRMKMKSMLML